jgi:hypothetical protein
MFGLSNSYSLQIRWPGYTSTRGAVRHAIIALAGGLLVMLVISLLGVSESAVTSLKPTVDSYDSNRSLTGMMDCGKIAK